MSTTVLETSPVWVYKLLSDNNCSKRPKSENSKKKETFFCEHCPIEYNEHLNKCTKNVSRLNRSRTEKTVLFYEQGDGDKIITMSAVRNLLEKVRDPLISFQDSRGLHTDSDHTFIGVLTALFHATYQAAITILTMLINLTPIFECFVLLGVFLLDKAIEICDTPDPKEKILKGLILFGEFVVIVVIVILMFLLILIPIFHLISYVFCKAWNMIFSSNNS